VEEKRRIVEETLVAGASVARVARAHGVNANQVFGWCRQYRQRLLGPGNGATASLLPVRVTAGLANAPARSSDEPGRQTALGTMHIEVPKGQVLIVGSVDAESLRVVLECLLR
jgi:transposase